MTGPLALCSLLLLIAFNEGRSRDAPSTDIDEETARYCRICADHTMCLFPFDDEGSRCVDAEDGELDDAEIAAILDRHNAYRAIVANGEEFRGNPGPQPAARAMMELMWDDELARVARRWAIQCNIWQMDRCRDVERFDVWQNVHVLDLDSVGSGTAAARIRFHIKSWYDAVERFDAAEVGLVNFAARNHSPYIALASATITYVGCGRAVYTSRRNESGGFGSRVEALVCNYGPVDRAAPGQLYEIGVPGRCPPGTMPSKYGTLCKKFQKWPRRRKVHRGPRAKQPRAEVRASRGTIPTARAVRLGRLVLLLLLLLLSRLSM